MIDLNLTNFITIGVIAMLFFSLVEFSKKKFNEGKK